MSNIIMDLTKISEEILTSAMVLTAMDELQKVTAKK